MRMIRIFTLTLPALFLLYLTRCFNTKPSDDNDPGPAEEDDEGGITVVDPGDQKRSETTATPPEVKLPGSNMEVKCEADGSKVLIDKVKEGGESFEISVKIYGSMQSALLALGLPKYQHSELSDVYISDSSGNLIAQRGISEISDVKEDQSLKILVFDNLWLMGVTGLTFLFRTMDGKFLKKTLQGEVATTDSFRTLKVYNLNQTAFENADYYDRHVSNNFAPEEKQYSFEKNADAQLQASFDAKFYTREEWSETIVTDLLGEVVAEHGENFHDLNQNTMFIVYRLMHRKFYFRTFVRMG